MSLHDRSDDKMDIKGDGVANDVVDVDSMEYGSQNFKDNEKAVATELKPVKIADTMAFMFESRHVIRPTRWAAETPLCQPDYDDVWSNFRKAQLP